MSVIYKFPYDTPLRYLPLVYLLPYDLLVRCPTLCKLPRSMGALNAPEWGDERPSRLEQAGFARPWPLPGGPLEGSQGGQSP